MRNQTMQMPTLCMPAWLVHWGCLLACRLCMPQTARAHLTWVAAGGCHLQVQATVKAGGKVLIPVSAVGRAQELLMLLQEHWDKEGLQVGAAGGACMQDCLL